MFCSESFNVSSRRKAGGAKTRREVPPGTVPSRTSWRTPANRCDDPCPIWLLPRSNDQLDGDSSEVGKGNLMHLAGGQLASLLECDRTRFSSPAALASRVRTPTTRTRPPGAPPSRPPGQVGDDGFFGFGHRHHLLRSKRSQ